MVWVSSLSFPSSNTQNGSLFPGEQKQQAFPNAVCTLGYREYDLIPELVPFRSAASRSVALVTLTCRKPTSLRFFRDPFRH